VTTPHIIVHPFANEGQLALHVIAGKNIVGVIIVQRGTATAALAFQVASHARAARADVRHHELLPVPDQGKALKDVSHRQNAIAGAKDCREF